jgi:hypothetical protein
VDSVNRELELHRCGKVLVAGRAVGRTDFIEESSLESSSRLRTSLSSFKFLKSRSELNSEARLRESFHKVAVPARTLSKFCHVTGCKVPVWTLSKSISEVPVRTLSPEVLL